MRNLLGSAVVGLNLCLCGSFAFAKCPINVVEIRVQSRDAAAIALFLEGDPASSEAMFVDGAARASHGYSLQFTYSSAKRWALGKCRFPSRAQLIVVHRNRPWERITVALPTVPIPSVPTPQVIEVEAD
jgi:hypothetical protein